MSSEPRAVVGATFRSQDSCPLVNQPSTHLGTATGDFADGRKVVDDMT